jgi:membrane protein YdbS with pleckstrin-like domain
MVDTAWHYLSFLWNYIPWWVFVIIGVVIVGFCWQFIAPIWSILPKPVKVALVFIGSILIAAQWGRNRARKDMEEQRAKDNANAIIERDKIDEQVKRLPPNVVDQHLRDGGWLRDE